MEPERPSDPNAELCMFCREPLRLNRRRLVGGHLYLVTDDERGVIESWDCENPECITNRTRKGALPDT
jgi:hypothetical protein